MSIYLDSIKGMKILSNHEIIEQFNCYRATGDQLARRNIINSTLRLVASIANRYKHFGKFEDMIQEGNIGVLKAIEKFDISMNVPWSNYAGQWITAYILKFIDNNQTVVKRGTSGKERKYYWRLSKARAKLEAQGKPADAESLANQFGLTKEQVEFILSRSTVDSTLESISPNNSEDLDKTEDILDKSTSNIELDIIQAMSNRDIEEKMNSFISKLSTKQKLIFMNRFMSDNYQTFSEIGSQLGVTRQRVQQIESELKSRFMKNINV